MTIFSSFSKASRGMMDFLPLAVAVSAGSALAKL